MLLCSCATVEKPAIDIDVPSVFRHAALDDLFVLREYEAGKNSFVESPERHTGAWTHKGFRYTLLEAEGSGSIRHIWTTRGEGEPYFDWEFYIDGEESPSIRATDEELIAAAEQYPIPVAPGNWVPFLKRDFNLYLPIPFDDSIRIDVVQRVAKFWLWFCQIDYRLEDESMRGVRLASQDVGDEMRFSYLGKTQRKVSRPASQLIQQTEKFENVPLRAGEMLAFAHLPGPAIIREIRLQRPADADLQLLMRYEDSDEFAVNTPVDRFFGPFESTVFYQHEVGDNSCYLPMPFRERCDVLLRNNGQQDVRISGKIVYEPVPTFSDEWGYFHALHQRTKETNGHRPHQVLYNRDRGHFLGMALYKTGHDHGGGDFTVIDGESSEPNFLHGVNGEDYFTFAWFGRGKHPPYAEAHSNDEGRIRLHLENPYPFDKSIAIEWGAFAGLSPESVAYWYQNSPHNTTLPGGAREESHQWDVFGPVPIPYGDDGRTQGDPFAVLPSVEALDKGQEFKCTLIDETFTSGWMKEWSVGPMLNLTYIGRHGTKIKGEIELGGMGHAFLARRYDHSDEAKTVDCTFAHDDPIELWLNGERIYQGGQFFNGFEPVQIDIPLQKGQNEIVVKLTNYFNRNFNWTGFLLRDL